MRIKDTKYSFSYNKTTAKTTCIATFKLDPDPLFKLLYDSNFKGFKSKVNHNLSVPKNYNIYRPFSVITSTTWNPDDKFNPVMGETIAKAKAEKFIYKKMKKLNEMIEEYIRTTLLKEFNTDANKYGLAYEKESDFLFRFAIMGEN